MHFFVVTIQQMVTKLQSSDTPKQHTVFAVYFPHFCDVMTNNLHFWFWFTFSDLHYPIVAPSSNRKGNHNSKMSIEQQRLYV